LPDHGDVLAGHGVGDADDVGPAGTELPEALGVKLLDRRGQSLEHLLQRQRAPVLNVESSSLVSHSSSSSRRSSSTSRRMMIRTAVPAFDEENSTSSTSDRISGMPRPRSNCSRSG